MRDPRRRRPGDRIVRRTLSRPIQLEAIARRLPRPSRPPPILFLFYVYAAVIALGTALLVLPISNEQGGSTPFMDAFFTASSATTVTGLVVVDTPTYWSSFGKGVIIAMIQVGGLGVMTATSLLFIFLGRRIGLRERLAMRGDTSALTVGGIVRLVRQIAKVVIVAETLGFIAFTLRFSQDFAWPSAIWHGFFHSISAFNNAGFVVLSGQGLGAYQSDALVLIITAAMIMVGGISVLVIADVVGKRSFSRLTLNSKIVISMSLVLWAFAMLLYLVLEYSNANSLGPLDVPGKLLNSFFHAVSGRTAGFFAIPFSGLEQSTLMLFLGLMLIGGTSASTTGGVKVSTLGAILVFVWSAVRGRPRAEVFSRQLPTEQVAMAITLMMLALGLVFIVAVVLAAMEDTALAEFGFIGLLFETVSALGTVGNSTGVTSSLSVAGQTVIIVTMVVGKVGPPTLILALARRGSRADYRYAEERVRIG